MKVNYLTACASLMLFAPISLSAAGQPPAEPAGSWSWPQHHGPQRTNISPETGLLKEWPAGGPPLIWKATECGAGYSGVSIAEGLIFTAGNIGKTEMVMAFDLDGQLRWKEPSGPAWELASPGSRATPTYYDGTVYMINPEGRLTAFEARTGRVRWTVDLVERFDAKWGVWGLAENLMVDDGKVYCMPGGVKGRVVALDPQTGATIWANTEDSGHRRLLLGDHHYAPRRTSMDQHDAAIRGIARSPHWRTPLDGSLRSPFAAEFVDARLRRWPPVRRGRPFVRRIATEDRR